MSSKRIEYIDMLKAFCIILVIAGHMGYTPIKMKLLLYIFHIPLFFFLSGMTLNVAKYTSFFEFFVRKFKTIVIPCLLMNISIFSIKSFILQPQFILKIDIIHFIKAMIVADRMHIYYQLWFLNVLFLAELVCYFAIKYSDTLYKYIIVYIVLILCGCLGKKLYEMEFWLIWSFDLVPYATIFILSGYILRRNLATLQSYFKILYFLPVVAVSIICGVYNTRVDLFYQQINSTLLYFVAAFFGIWASFILFKNIPNIPILERIGGNTLIYYAYHSPIVLYILDIIMEQLAGKYTGIFVSNYIIAIVELFLAIILCELIAKIINNTFPFIIGKSFKTT
ncbi:acyltransferase [uncultured Gemella sp.]|uniref:acyltransferase n=1 Tax=uncultured Gemella sp. TaxID=254352 RepID=UPI0028D7C799|nr:acyltransferase [uncultured Gemella sp.]